MEKHSVLSCSNLSLTFDPQWEHTWSINGSVSIHVFLVWHQFRQTPCLLIRTLNVTFTFLIPDLKKTNFTGMYQQLI